MPKSKIDEDHEVLLDTVAIVVQARRDGRSTPGDAISSKALHDATSLEARLGELPRNPAIRDDIRAGADARQYEVEGMMADIGDAIIPEETTTSHRHAPRPGPAATRYQPHPSANTPDGMHSRARAIDMPAPVHSPPQQPHAIKSIDAQAVDLP
ncbi:hypothetical protein LTR53_015933, partial [Teratosphaeriaceae sp. CCFEE 6253]